jgi:hypothetical protein
VGAVVEDVANRIVLVADDLVVRGIEAELRLRPAALPYILLPAVAVAIVNKANRSVVPSVKIALAGKPPELVVGLCCAVAHSGIGHALHLVPDSGQKRPVDCAASTAGLLDRAVGAHGQLVCSSKRVVLIHAV